ncbi:MAG TPA: XdhC family protein [Candidatus Angelobacter sp.]|nr:XdhC family protein [Candidatus Angelobacter sp.]
MFDQILKTMAELWAGGESFVTATVVRALPPTSGKPGDKAIIHANGKLSGWIGGGCAQPVVVKEALKALADGRPRLVRISPSENNPEEGTVDYTMTCHSGGALDIYLEPVLPKPRIMILGRSPVARILAHLASTVGYAVSVVTSDPAAEEFAGAEIVASGDFNLKDVKITPQTFVVVSTQGEGDEEALEQALRSDAGYVAFVASKTKAAKVLDFLQKRGLNPEQSRRLRAPAGLDIGATSPEEIAVSILAEIVQVRASAAKAASQPKASKALNVINNDAKDPICGMTVDKSKARYKADFEGKTFYFCCAGCKQSFEQAPQRYALANS